MAYNTYYKLSIVPDNPVVWRTLFMIEEAGFALTSSGASNNQCSWYEHEKDLKNLSAQFPDQLFTLKGEGDEAGDIWVKYFKAGKMQISKALIVIEPFHPSKLE